MALTTFRATLDEEYRSIISSYSFSISLDTHSMNFPCRKSSHILWYGLFAGSYCTKQFVSRTTNRFMTDKEF
ncbi:hypothetical protein IMSAGC004_02557 [Bacteroidaceae bacterium]|uniref:hypothetical protein n=1 Tax=uncultured Phocaeicola sp. TaxID=990718 RepID=UPI001434D850|nr:hypothetical protein IMSAGC004_02557 [Bacteroidaceae bacterium]